MGQLWLFDQEFGGSSNYVPGQSQATLKALSLLSACRMLTKTAAGIRRNTLILIRPWADDKSSFTLEKLSIELEQSIGAAGLVLRELQAVQKKKRRTLQAAE
jgi:hypothetical protein